MNLALPVVSGDASHPRWRTYLVHALRVILVLALLVSVPSAAILPRDGLTPPSLSGMILAGHRIPPNCVIAQRDEQTGLWGLDDPDGKRVGWIARTFPDAKIAMGYRGPTEASILLSRDLKVLSVRLLSSEDTKDHVTAVERDDAFFDQFIDWDWTANSDSRIIDGVSGATLTSLALAEGVARRMGGEAPSLVFPAPISLEEVKSRFDDAVAVNPDTGEVVDSKNEWIGSVLRTGKLSDDVVGYQGPTELLIQLDTTHKIQSVKIRKSFDNEPYVDYVRTEYGFWKLFRGMDMKQLADFDPIAEGVEGVSGATMTSQTIAHTLVQAAQKYNANLQVKDSVESTLAVRWSWLDVATGAMLFLAIFIQSFGQRVMKRYRKVWLLAVIVLLGFWTGNLLSMTLVMGWSAEGIAWQLAPGLFGVCLVAFLFPVFTKKNIYCNHLCPHGAIQQLVKPTKVSPRIRSLRGRIPSSLAIMPGLILLIAYLTLQYSPTTDLSGWEPFHAYLIRVATWWAIAFAIITLAISRFLPMAYCRYGCPTGALLDYLRFNARSGFVQRKDILMMVLLLAVWSIRWYSR